MPITILDLVLLGVMLISGLLAMMVRELTPEGSLALKSLEGEDGPQQFGPAGADEARVIAEVTETFKRHEGKKAGALIELSPREFQLLAFFIQHRGVDAG